MLKRVKMEGEEGSPVTYIFKIGRTFRPQKCPAGPASTSSNVGKPSLFPRRSAAAMRARADG